ncbi:MAG: FAD-binding oxidoreductase, partial [Proteobacteria bacterium]
MSFQTFDTVVIGAGAIGSAVGMGLGKLSSGSVAVVDFDLEGTWSSSELNAGGVRATWNQPVNVLASKLSIDYFASVASDVGYRDAGYLWLCRDEDLKARTASLELWKKLKWEVGVLNVSEIRVRYPFLDRTDDLAGAVLGVRDGLINPNLLKTHFRDQAKRAGVEFKDRLKLVSAERNPNDSYWRLTFESFAKGLETEARKSVLLDETRSPERVEIRCQNVVNCAGAWASDVAKLFEVDCPSYAVRRQISMFDCRTLDLSPYGMIIDTSGVYFHSEA